MLGVADLALELVTRLGWYGRLLVGFGCELAQLVLYQRGTSVR
jgi:hypothetical protein